jgi:hypothetical protein
MSYPYFDCVQRAHGELLAEGKIKARATQEEVEQDKGLLTRRAMYYANQRDPSHGLLEKTEGNNSLGLSVDWALRQTDGVGWDITTDDGTNALPVNGDAHDADPAYIPRWVQPTAELAQISGTPTPGPTPPTPPVDYAAKLDALTAKVDALTTLVIEQQEMTYHMLTQTWAGECALATRMNFGLKCPPMPPKE